MWSCSLCNFILTTETARTNHTLVINMSLIYLAFQRCFRPTRPSLESIIKGPIQAQFLIKFYLCSPEICSFLTRRIYKTTEFLPFHCSWKVYHDVHWENYLFTAIAAGKIEERQSQEKPLSNEWLLDICQCLLIKLLEALWLYLRNWDNYLRIKKLIYLNILSVVTSRIEKEDSWMRPVITL